MTARAPMEIGPRLACPPIDIDELRGQPTTVDKDAIREIGRRYQAPSSTFGLELKVAHALEAAGHADDRLRRLYYRPAQEPLIWSWWDALQRVPLDAEEMGSFASLLAGKAVSRRAGGMASLAGGEGGADLPYEAPAQSGTWLADIARADASGGDPVRIALYRFARIVCAHPYSDANGRLARAALQAGLARGGLIATPCLAPTPAFCLRAAEIRASLLDLSRTGAWDAYFERMGSALAECVARVEALGTLPSPID